MEQLDNLNNDSMLKLYRNDCFEKLFKSEIFTTNTIDSKLSSQSKLYYQMKGKDKKLVLESLKETSAYNKDFSDLKVEYLSQSSNKIINLQYFKLFI